MQLGMIGLGRMGANMARRLMAHQHRCVAYDVSEAAVTALAQHGAVRSGSYAELVQKLDPPRCLWLMVPAAVVDSTLSELLGHLSPGDIVVDGGNSYYRDDVRRAALLAQRGLHYIDCGTSGGVWGRERGYCLMIGGESEPVRRMTPIFESLAPGSGDVVDTLARASPREGTPARAGSRASSAEQGYLHCGPAGAGHFVKMVHNGIEYGLMAAYAEGLNILQHANVGSRNTGLADAETAPMAQPENYRYELDLAQISELWRHGSVIGSWLLDLAADALARDPQLAQFSGHVADSGEGRWTLTAAIEEGVPAPVLSAALFERFASRGHAEFQNRVLSALRLEFGGHVERKHD
jgi:6-phosphogluconate dehydrogenase